MFDLRDALARFSGEFVDFDELLRILRQIRKDHIAEISPETSEREFLRLAQAKDWVTEDETGKFRIAVMQAA